MKVSIIEEETGRLVATYELARAMGSANYPLSKEEWYSDAWRLAVIDDAVDADQRDKYRFHIIEETE